MIVHHVFISWWLALGEKRGDSGRTYLTTPNDVMLQYLVIDDRIVHVRVLDMLRYGRTPAGEQSPDFPRRNEYLVRRRHAVNAPDTSV